MTLPGLVAANNLSDVADRERAWDNLGSNISANYSVPSPSLDLNFAANKNLIDNVSGQALIIFSRASTGTFVGSNGLIQTAASGVPRFDHNPATGESLGLLVEESRTNFFAHSTNFSSSWSTTQLNVVLNSISSPDGSLSAAFLQPTNVNSTHKFFQNVSSSTSALIFSVYLKAGGYSRVALNEQAQTGTSSSIINLTNGSGSSANTLVTNAGNGWYRVSFSSSFGVFTPKSFAIVILPNGGAGENPNSFSWTGDNVSGVYAWGAQVEAGAFPTSYIPTTTTAVTRAADTLTISGSNFSGWYKQNQGTIYLRSSPSTSDANGVSFNDGTANNQNVLGLSGSNAARQTVTVSGVAQVSSVTSAGSVALGEFRAIAASYEPNLFKLAAHSAAIVPDPAGTLPTVNQATIGPIGTISRILYWPSALPSNVLQAIVAPSASDPLVNFSNSFSVKGRDALALNQVSNASTRDFAFVRGLSSAAQPRLTVAAQNTASGIAFRDVALLKVSPLSEGNYLISRGSLNAQSLRVNNINVASLSVAPFSGSTALFPLSINTIEAPSNFRFTRIFVSGIVASPERAIPIETSSFILYAKAGQN